MMYPIRLTILMILLVFLARTAIATPLDEPALRALFEEAVAVAQPVGVQVSIIRDGQQLDFVHGLANAELEIPMTEDTLIQIGSTTKILNAAIVMSLVDENKLQLDVPVRTYLPDFKVASEQATATITLGQLLSMSSGLDNGRYTDHGAGGEALGRYVESLADLPQAFPPGQGFGYSNAGTSIAGYAAERATGTAWDDLLLERILKPAGLTHAASLERELLFQRVSVGHSIDKESGAVTVIRPWHLTRAQGPAGSTLAMSAHDLARFGKLFLTGGIADNGNRVLSEAAVKAMTTPRTPVPTTMADAWGIGPYAFEWTGTTVWGHSGGNMSGISDLRWIPALNGVIAFTTNTPGSAGRFLKVVFTRIAEEAFGISHTPLEKPESPALIENPQRYLGRYCGADTTFVVEQKDERSLTLNGEIARLPPTSVTLLSLGGDRFFQDHGKDADPLALAIVSDVAFFGADSAGRATTILPGPFAFARCD